MKRFRLPLAAAVAVVTVGTVFAVIPSASASVPFAVESLDGSGNNVNNPTFGQAGRPYARVGTAHYADGIATPVAGPNARAISNRIIQDTHQNVFSERRVTQWAWTWGQFLDHTFGHRQETGSTATPFNIPFDANDPMEAFSSNLGVIAVNRSPQAPGTGTSTSNPRQQTNTLPSYIGGNPIYGATPDRLDWLRDGSLDGNPANNNATLMLPGGYLPRKTARGNAAAAPATDVDGRLLANPNSAMVAGDVRANENIALSATHTLFAREHNRIVSLLPSSLSQEDKFQIARRVVIAEQQYITYQEFLPAMGVALPKYSGYRSNINTALSNEFATVGYRAHSQIHGELEFDVAANRYTQAQLDGFTGQGVELGVSDEDPTQLEVAVPLNVEFFNPDLLQGIGEGPILQSLGDSQYNNDEEIDDALRSVLFQVPVPGNTDCLDGPTQATCFTGVNDLGAIDIQRARDHGIGTFNQLRQAYGLSAITSFTQLTGEATDAFPAGLSADTPASLDVTSLKNIDGTPVDLNDPVAVANTPTVDVRRSTVAARLKAVYGGDVNKIDAFVGLIAEKHVPGTEFGATQLAIWTREFTRLRDGDRFFYGNDQGLSFIKKNFGIDYRRSLAQIISDNSDAADLNPNVFLVPDDDLPAATCSFEYHFNAFTNGAFQVYITIRNNTSQPITGWTAKFELANGQGIFQTANAIFNQSGPNGRDVSVTPLGSVNATIPANGSTPTGGVAGTIAFNATMDNFTNARPPNATLNGKRCATPFV
jgi:peroxidase